MGSRPKFNRARIAHCNFCDQSFLSRFARPRHIQTRTSFVEKAMKRKNPVSLTCFCMYTLASPAAPRSREFAAQPALNTGKQTAKSGESIVFAPVGYTEVTRIALSPQGLSRVMAEQYSTAL